MHIFSWNASGSADCEGEASILLHSKETQQPAQEEALFIF
jgi:hypothetical protein